MVFIAAAHDYLLTNVEMHPNMLKLVNQNNITLLWITWHMGQ